MPDSIGGDVTVDWPADGIAVMRMPREFDVYSAPRVRETSLDVVNRGGYRIVADLGPTESIDSTGLGVLVGMLKRARGHDGTVVLADVGERVRKPFRISGVAKVFDFHDSVDEAVAALQAGRPGPG